MLAGALLAAYMLTSCSDDDAAGDDVVNYVDMNFTFAMPQRIIGDTAQTRMTAEVVQENGTVETFRGLDDIHLLAFDAMPGPQSRHRGEIAYLRNTNGRILNLATENDYSVACQVKVPVGTSHFAFYAHAIDGGTTPQERFHYGAIETKGLASSEGNSAIAFAPVPICNSQAEQGGSAVGQALVRLLNSLMSITGPEKAPDDRWPTAADERLREAYRGMTELRTLSSASVERVLGQVYRQVTMIPDEYPGRQLGDAIAAAIAAACTETPAAGSTELTLISDYQGFPADLFLPEGAARIEWDAAAQKYVTPKAQVYGKGLDIASMGDYVYPANLQYLALSPLVASDELALPGNELAQQDPVVYANWQELINQAYADGYDRVKESTQSVAMVDQVHYSVGRLDTRVTLASRTLYDAFGKAIDASAGFTLKGVIVGGQREVGYDFEPKADAKEYCLYDTDLNGGEQHVTHTGYTDYNHTLGLPTSADNDILLALELVNLGPDFQGADGRIAHGATFYLVADMIPSTGSNYKKNQLDRVFQRDHVTKVNLEVLTGKPDINGDGIPDTDSNGDGIPDVYVKDADGIPTGIDTDGNGKPDDYDANGDGKPDTIVTEDTDSDGKPDLVGWDTDGDGDIDIPITPGTDGDYADTPTDASGLGTATYGIPTLTDKNESRTFGLSVDLNWGKGLSFDDVIL